MDKKVVLEGCLGDWSKKSYIEPLAERARLDTIELYAVDIRDIREDEDKAEYYKSPVIFVNRKLKEGKKEYDTIKDVDFVFVVAPHEFHCDIADHWLEEGRLNKNGKIFIEKPLDSSVENIKELEEKYGEEELNRKIIAVDHYISKVLPLIEELEERKGKYGEIKKIRINILESGLILDSRKKTLDEGLILDIFPHVLAVFTKIMKACYGDFTLNADNFEIIKVETGRYESAPIKGETFAKIVAKIEGIKIESLIGKAVGFRDNKTIEIFFEKGSKTANFTSGNDICKLLDRIFKNKFDKNEFLKESLTFSEGYEIVKIISKIRNKAGKLTKYKRWSSLSEILMNPRSFDDKDKAAVDVLLNQYDFLREEVVRCIYLEHAAIIALYTSLGLTVAFLIREGITQKLNLCDLAYNLGSDETILFLFALIFAQVIINGFGSLFLKEQARNRRACSFLKAIEYLMNKKIGEIGIYWENYITSRLIDKKLRIADFFKFEISINPQYYKNRLLGVGLPVFLPNFLITLAIGFAWFASCEKNSLTFLIIFILFAVIVFLSLELPKYSLIIPIISVIGVMWYLIIEESSALLFILFFISFLITYFWAFMIMLRSSTSLKKEKVPIREEVLAWLEEEQIFL